jgi:hypothetical protein
MTLDELLTEDITSEMKKLRETPYDDKNYGTVSDTVVKLMGQKIEMDRSESERLFREKQLKDEKKDRLIKNIISVAGIVLPLVVTVWGTKVSLRFEEEGTVTTPIGRGFISKLLPKK